MNIPTPTPGLIFNGLNQRETKPGFYEGFSEVLEVVSIDSDIIVFKDELGRPGKVTTRSWVPFFESGYYYL